jgi:hypothetical protein
MASHWLIHSLGFRLCLYIYIYMFKFRVGNSFTRNQILLHVCVQTLDLAPRQLANIFFLSWFIC